MQCTEDIHTPLAIDLEIKKHILNCLWSKKQITGEGENILNQMKTKTYIKIYGMQLRYCIEQNLLL